ncbi:MAG TPA: hypothetical protein DEP72_07945 [Clostridiales bacterium]|nr:MAG: hypothetical protein A2Y18_06610 [Clostridiales bacterium GWD2_32_19]HCC08068.1 hypothetical protein [Clostridiales bacterium]
MENNKKEKTNIIVNNENDAIFYIDPLDGDGFRFPYLLYTPNNIKNGSPIFVAGNNSREINKDYEVDIEQAFNMIKGTLKIPIFNESRVPILMPIFPSFYGECGECGECEECEKEKYIQQLSRNTMLIKDGNLARIDLQLIAMINNAKELLLKYE